MILSGSIREKLVIESSYSFGVINWIGHTTELSFAERGVGRDNLWFNRMGVLGLVIF